MWGGGRGAAYHDSVRITIQHFHFSDATSCSDTGVTTSPCLQCTKRRCSLSKQTVFTVRCLWNDYDFSSPFTTIRRYQGNCPTVPGTALCLTGRISSTTCFVISTRSVPGVKTSLRVPTLLKSAALGASPSAISATSTVFPSTRYPGWTPTDSADSKEQHWPCSNRMKNGVASSLVLIVVFTGKSVCSLGCRRHRKNCLPCKAKRG